MSLIEYKHNDGDDYVTETVTTSTQTAEVYGHIKYRQLRLSLSGTKLLNNGNNSETVTIEAVSGLDVACGDDPTVLDYDGDVKLTIDGVETAKTLTDGSVSFDVTTEKSAGSSIEVVAESLADHPAESDRAEIEVISP